MSTQEDCYALFKYVEVPEQNPSYSMFSMMFAIERPPQSCACDQDEDESCDICKPPKAKTKRVLTFVCMVKSPSEVAAQIRKDPLHEYTILCGQMKQVKIAIPVFMDGRNLDTLNDEWSAAK